MAYNKPTDQTGAWQNYTSDRAVDGSYNTNQYEGSCVHPDDYNISQAWWRVDLERLHRIYNVTLYNTGSVDGNALTSPDLPDFWERKPMPLITPPKKYPITLYIT